VQKNNGEDVRIFTKQFGGTAPPPAVPPNVSARTSSFGGKEQKEKSKK
jgi:hypothetical protein